jgi:3-deoxy-manno-octulosonate cytidylyltransferase (CMP-KDO synthetase)
MKVVCVIPARLKSTRFPRKMLSIIHGKPLLQWVWEAASKVKIFDKVVFAVDASEIADLVKSFGANVEMTAESCASGTDRLVELHKKNRLKADIWVNWQGDEPFIQEGMIHDLLQTCSSEQSDLWTLKKRITHREEINSPQVAKVVCDVKGFALYFSRSTIPHYRDPRPDHEKIYFKHIGLYAFTSDALEKISHLPFFYLEEAEQLEQLRFLANGLKIRVHETHDDVFGIDLPEHLAKAEQRLKQRKDIS